MPAQETGRQPSGVRLSEVAREWTRIGVTGFGGPPPHIALLRALCVERRGWIGGREFQDAIAVCNLLPGPASTQLAIYCAGRLAGWPGAVVGGACFIVPGLVVILGLAAVFLAASPPRAVLALAAGGGAAVAAVAVRAGVDLLRPSWRGVRRSGSAARWLAYLVAGGISAVAVGPWLVLVLLACGLAELAARRLVGGGIGVLLAAPAPGGLGALAWTAFKVGGLSYGGGFVIVPLMQSDAVSRYHWMTAPQFLDAVALGQITPGPVTQTVAVVGYAAAGVGGGLLAAAIAFAPSFALVLIGRRRFDRVRRDPRAEAFLAGAGPAAIGAILGASVPLARALSEPWQYAVLAAAAVALVVLRRGVVPVLAGAALAGLVALAAGAVIPG
jgi:chromate transporter